MPFQKIVADKLSLAIVSQIELMILRAILRPGERLPAERDLAEKLGVSRPSLREALVELQERGLLVSRPSSGVFVADVLGTAFAPALVRLFASHSQAKFDYIDFRIDLEGMAAARAARLGSDLDHELIHNIFEQMVVAHDKRDPTDESELDVEFHVSILEASHNIVLLHMTQSIYALIREGVFHNLQLFYNDRSSRRAMLDQHRAIHDAILARDPEAAKAAVARHMGFVRQFMLDRIRAEQQDEVSRQRLNHVMDR
jgi:GntR family transcriptional repressor for pyruvate dehydrogenase complex